jgi:hypothetical protein
MVSTKVIISGLCLLFACAASTAPALAGPPFVTDDPDPTQYRGWEIYTGLTYSNEVAGGVDASLPFAEFNYGLMPNVQISASLPMQYDRSDSNHGLHYGDTDLGIKVRFIQESGGVPQVAFYPSVEISSTGGKPRVFLPLWLQKSWGPWTAFGGGGLSIGSGGERGDNSLEGVTLVRDLSPATSLGIECFHEGASEHGGAPTTAFNLGAIARLGPDHAILFSAGRAFDASNSAMLYGAYEFRLGTESGNQK